MPSSSERAVIDLEELGWRIERHGIASVPADELASVAVHAAEQGLAPVLAAVLTDPREPVPARERAFGRLALLLAHDRGAGFVLVA